MRKIVRNKKAVLFLVLVTIGLTFLLKPLDAQAVSPGAIIPNADTGVGLTNTVTGTNTASPTSPVTNAPTATTPDTAATQAAAATTSDIGPLSQMIGRQTGYVYQAWQSIRVIINILLVIALLLISFSNILHINIDTYTIKKALPNLIIGVILANASFFVIRLFADVASATVQLFLNLAHANNFSSFVKVIVKTVSVTTAGSLVGGGKGALQSFLQVVFGLIVGIGLLWLALLLYIRLVFIYLLTIISPLAFISYGIPGLDKYFRMWWQNFIKWLFMLTALTAMFWLQYVICSAGHTADQVASGTANFSVAQTITCFVIFFLALSIPSKLGGAIMDKSAKAFSKYSGLDYAKKTAGDTAKLYGQKLAWSTPGLSHFMAGSQRRKELLESQIKNRKDKAFSEYDRGILGKGSRTGKKLALEERRAFQQDLDKDRIKNINAANAAKSRSGQKIENNIVGLEKQKEAAEKILNGIRAKVKLDWMIDATAKREAWRGPNAVPGLRNKVGAYFGNIRKDARNEIMMSAFSATEDAETLEKAVGSEEKKAAGSYATKSKVPLQALANFEAKEKLFESIKNSTNPEDIKLANTLKTEMDDIKKGFKKKLDAGDYKGKFVDSGGRDFKTFDEIYKSAWKDEGAIGKAIQARRKVTYAKEMEGIAAIIGDDVKDITTTEYNGRLQQHMQKFKTLEQKQAFIQGNTAKLIELGVEDKDIQGGLELMEMGKQIAKTDRFRRAGVMKSVAQAAQDSGIKGIDALQVEAAMNNNKTVNQMMQFMTQNVGAMAGAYSSRWIDAKGFDQAAFTNAYNQALTAPGGTGGQNAGAGGNQGGQNTPGGQNQNQNQNANPPVTPISYYMANAPQVPGATQQTPATPSAAAPQTNSQATTNPVANFINGNNPPQTQAQQPAPQAADDEDPTEDEEDENYQGGA